MRAGIDESRVAQERITGAKAVPYRTAGQIVLAFKVLGIRIS